MSTSTDGQICYGVSFPEEFEFPWSFLDDYETEEWWRNELGYCPPFEIWTDKGEKIAGVTQAMTNEYYDHRRAWGAKHPLPFTLVNACSIDYPMMILAAPSSVMRANRGFPVDFDPRSLVPDPGEVEALKDFISKYGLGSNQFKWWLSSYWG